MTKIDPLDPPKVDASANAYVSRAATLEKLVDSRVFITTARVLMICASTIGLPIAGWYMTRLVATADRIIDKVDDSATELKLLKSDMRAGFDKNKDDINRNSEWLRDHEGRIRVLERVSGGGLPIRPN